MPGWRVGWYEPDKRKVKAFPNKTPAEPVKQAKATNKPTKLARHSRRLEVTVTDVHEIVVIRC